MEASPSTGVVADASVLVNFLRIDRVDLIAGHSHGFIVTDHVADEVSDRYPDQQQRFASAVKAGALSQQSVTHPSRQGSLRFGIFSAPGGNIGAESALGLWHVGGIHDDTKHKQLI